MLLPFLLFFGSFFPTAEVPATGLQLIFELEEASERGTLRVAIFASEADFKEDQATYSNNQSVNGPGDIRMSFPNISSGTYAVAAFYDRNDNQKLDRNLFGVPTEAYGFINEPASKWRAPRWDEISTKIEDEELELRIVLKKWSAR
ncbi:MAG: DUF2141 domain-containing protein [Bacteroidota bacterium]